MILNRQQAVRIPRRPLELFLAKVRRELRIGAGEVTICFVSDAEIARMNQAFRGKHGPTDVLSFPAEEREAPRSPARARSAKRGRRAAERRWGDVAISPQTARRNAKRLGRALPDELRILILHGVLHLLGYDHESDNGEMDRVEGRLRGRLGLA